MPRKPSPRYFESRKAYYCQFAGRQHLLASGPDDAPNGPTYLAALEAFRHLMAGTNVEEDGDENLVEVILEKYLQHAKNKLKASTLERSVFMLTPFQQALGALPVGKLTHFKVEEFLEEQRRPRRVGSRVYTWGDVTIATFLQVANAAFNWAVRRKLISANPLAGMEKPLMRSRGRDRLLALGDHERIMKCCKSRAMKRLLVALENTGARPGEITHARTTDWDDRLGALVYYADDRRREDEFRHKTARYKDRVIYFTGEALEMVRGLVLSTPAGGYLFGSKKGTPFAKPSVSSFFGRVQRKLKWEAVTAYCYRHTFATNWLLAGKPIEVLAELLGNTPATIMKHYAHLCRNRQAIRRQLEEFRQIHAATSDERT
jgi:integrase